MSIAYETIQDGVSDGWIAVILLPVFDREVGFDDGGAGPVPVFDELKEAAAI